MSNIKITCDSSCDLSQELYEKYDVEVIPFGIYFGEELRTDGVDVQCEDLYEFADRTGKLPKTVAVSPSGYAEVFKKYTDQGMSVIHINLSSEMSSTHQNALIAASELPNVYPIDSRNLSSGSGHLVLLAKELADQGLSAPEIVDILNEAKTRLDVSFVLTTLNYLVMGGRCSALKAFGANLLNLHPEIKVRNGVMGVGKKYRGNMKKYVDAYIHGALDNRTDIDTHRIFVTHSPMDPAIVQYAVDLVKSMYDFDEVLETPAGCTVSAHCGPGTIGVLFFTKKE
ncbi:MAG: DegV family protein [Lachnospiraceae bacterium]|nr:DegV family protein [Lachnospiraceae bacterium]